MKKLIEVLKEKIRNRLEMTRDRWRYSGWKYRVKLVTKTAGVGAALLLAAGLAVAYAVGLSSSGDSDVHVELDRSASLTGIDVDKNGVRDDIDAYIKAMTDKEGWSIVQAKATQQQARSMQKVLTFERIKGDKRAAARFVAKEMSSAIDCEFFRFGASAAKIGTQMNHVILNTKERILANDRFGEAMNGAVITDAPWETSCVP